MNNLKATLGHQNTLMSCWTNNPTEVHGIENRGHKSSLITDTQVSALGFRVRPSTDSEIMQADTGPIFGLEKRSLFNQQYEDICND